MKAIFAKLIYTMAGEPLRDGCILIDGKRIAAIGQKLELSEGTERVDFSDCVILPGLIDAHSHIGQFGIKDVSGSNDFSDPICPQMDIANGVNPFHESFGAARNAGFTSCCILPGSGNLMGGTGRVVKLKKEVDFRKTVYGPLQIKMALGENPARCYGNKGRSPMTRMGNAALLREAMREAKAYYTAKKAGAPKEYDARWEALLPLFEGSAVAHIHCHRMDDILTAVYLMEEYGVRYSIDHTTEGHFVKDILAEKQVNCICGPISCGPQKQETWHCTPKSPAILEKAGVRTICLSIDGDSYVSALPLDVGICMAHGLSEEAALKSVTICPAQVLGIADRTGTLEIGKDADIAVFDGFPFSNYSRCRGVFIEGTYYRSEV